MGHPAQIVIIEDGRHLVVYDKSGGWPGLEYRVLLDRSWFTMENWADRCDGRWHSCPDAVYLVDHDRKALLLSFLHLYDFPDEHAYRVLLLRLLRQVWKGWPASPRGSSPACSAGRARTGWRGRSRPPGEVAMADPWNMNGIAALTTLGAGAVALAAAAAMLFGARRRQRGTLLTAGVLAALWCLLDAVEAGDVAGSDGARADIGPGIGLLLALLGALAVIAAGAAVRPDPVQDLLAASERIERRSRHAINRDVVADQQRLVAAGERRLGADHPAVLTLWLNDLRRRAVPVMPAAPMLGGPMPGAPMPPPPGWRPPPPAAWPHHHPPGPPPGPPPRR